METTKNEMSTPVVDFVKAYADSVMTRLHMPGHKGHSILGCEAYDITEIAGADSLYEADGILAQSEENATRLFGTGRTLYATEGSSQCIRAMLYLVQMGYRQGRKPVLVAARNVHKSFVYAAALLDLEVIWLWPENETDSLCSCTVTAEALERVLSGLQARQTAVAAVYLTSPDYLGGMLDIREMARVCHRYGTVLAVDNAHGAYLHFLQCPQHPIDLGADICCDSAHKTLPVLTGGAYLHIHKDAPYRFRTAAKEAMALFGSTSPSYLILASLDCCNRYLAQGYRERLACKIKEIKELKRQLNVMGWQLKGQEDLKVTVRAPKGRSGSWLAAYLRAHAIECEYADPQAVVWMLTPENSSEDIEKIRTCMEQLRRSLDEKELYDEETGSRRVPCHVGLSIREAVFAPHETIPIAKAEGRICAAPTVSCPPAIPIVISGEVIDKNILQIFEYYGIMSVDVVI